MRQALLVLLLLTSTARADVDRWIRPLAEGGLVLATELPLKPLLAPSACRWCDPPALDERARTLHWDRQDVADGMSYGTLGADAALSVGLLLTGRHLGDLAPVLESATTAALLAQLAKFTVGRSRPFVHHAAPGRAHEPDDDVSFFSGHTAIAFSIAAAAGTVATERGYAAAPWIWAGGLALAGATGYLRIAADRHYLTDVLMGGLVGTAVGMLVPRLTTGGSESSAMPLLVGCW